MKLWVFILRRTNAQSGYVMPTVCVLLVLVLPILRASMDTDTAMDTATAEPFVYRFTLHSNVDPKAGVKLL